MERKFYIILTILWIVFITTLSLVSFNNNKFSAIQNSDKIVHFVFYFVLTMLLLFVFDKSKKYKYLIVITLAISYGIVIEILQNKFTLTRKAEFYDIIANSTGTICAALLNKYLFESIFSNIIKKN